MEFKNKLKLRFCMAIGYIVIGIVLVLVSRLGVVKNEMISAFGIVLAVMGVIRVIQYLRLSRDESAIHAREIAENDERNIMIMTKARSLTFSIFLMLAGIAEVVLYALDMQSEGLIVAYTICAFALLYFICYQIIRRRY